MLKKKKERTLEEEVDSLREIRTELTNRNEELRRKDAELIDRNETLRRNNEELMKEYLELADKLNRVRSTSSYTNKALSLLFETLHKGYFNGDTFEIEADEDYLEKYINIRDLCRVYFIPKIGSFAYFYEDKLYVLEGWYKRERQTFTLKRVREIKPKEGSNYENKIV